MEPLFPAIEPYATHMLPVTDGHTLYVEESGNPRGLPVLVLHGGPGSGCSPDHRRRFDPSIWRIVCLDQRGCGRSIAPSEGVLYANTTPHLVADNEAVREALGIAHWACVYGTSWGSTLALVYAEAHPTVLKSMVLGGIWLADEEGFAWWTDPMGLAQMLPNEFKKVQAYGPGLKGRDLLKAVLQSGEEAIEAQIYYESMAAELDPQPEGVRAYLQTPQGRNGSVLELNYMANRCYLEDGQILANIGKIAHLPITILQGLQDMVCPPKGAHKLADALRAAGGNPTLRMVGACGHRSTSAMEAARVEAIAATAKQIAA